jgi:hypothetical protein
MERAFDFLILAIAILLVAILATFGIAIFRNNKTNLNSNSNKVFSLADQYIAGEFTQYNTKEVLGSDVIWAIKRYAAKNSGSTDSSKLTIIVQKVGKSPSTQQYFKEDITGVAVDSCNINPDSIYTAKILWKSYDGNAYDIDKKEEHSYTREDVVGILFVQKQSYMKSL